MFSCGRGIETAPGSVTPLTPCDLYANEGESGGACVSQCEFAVRVDRVTALCNSGINTLFNCDKLLKVDCLVFVQECGILQPGWSISCNESLFLN